MRFSRFVLPGIIAVVTWTSSNLQWGGDNWRNIIEADAKGYYAYLPALFIYRDIHFGFHDSVEARYADENTRYEYRTQHNGQVINKYYLGTAIAQLPFFACAHLASKAAGYPADGYSKLYPVFINAGAIVFLLIGLVYVRNLLRSFKVSDPLIAFLLIALVFGTNLFYYAVCEPGLSHVYSFTFISMFVYRARKFFITQHSKEIIYCSLLLGVIFLIRPVNFLIVLSLPFLAGSAQQLKAGFRAALHKKASLAGILGLTVLGSLQFMMYKAQCGDFFVYSYGEERFNWRHPHPIDFLFSYKKGFFLYTPLAFISLAGFLYLWKRNRFSFYSLALFFTVLIYVLSAWWNWWYGGSFGSRVMIDYLVFIALLLAFAYKQFEARISKAVLTVTIVLTVLLCQFQTYQYRYHLIHWEDMSKEKYWEVFLRMPQS
ncbi:MAG: hypothetical protein AB1458_07435 [Bacteroidota bacterium]